IRLPLPRRLLSNQGRPFWIGLAVAVIQGGLVLYLAQRQGLWALVAMLVVGAFELWNARPGGVKAARRAEELWAHTPALLMGLSVVLIVAVSPRMATQVAVVLAYAGWRWWWGSGGAENQTKL